MTVLVTDGGGGQTDPPIAHEVGEHDAKIENHESRITEAEHTIESHTAELAAIPERLVGMASSVPEEVWTRIQALEAKVEALPDQVLDQVDSLADDKLPDVPAPVQPHKNPAADPAPKVKSSNPILSFLRRF